MLFQSSSPHKSSWKTPRWWWQKSSAWSCIIEHGWEKWEVWVCGSYVPLLCPLREWHGFVASIVWPFEVVFPTLTVTSLLSPEDDPLTKTIKVLPFAEYGTREWRHSLPSWACSSSFCAQTHCCSTFMGSHSSSSTDYKFYSFTPAILNWVGIAALVTFQGGKLTQGVIPVKNSDRECTIMVQVSSSVFPVSLVSTRGWSPHHVTCSAHLFCVHKQSADGIQDRCPHLSFANLSTNLMLETGLFVSCLLYKTRTYLFFPVHLVVSLLQHPTTRSSGYSGCTSPRQCCFAIRFTA